MDLQFVQNMATAKVLASLVCTEEGSLCIVSQIWCQRAERSLRVSHWSQVKEVYYKINILQYSILVAI